MRVSAASLCGMYMDDWVGLAPTRWKLRMAIRAVNQVMARLWVRQHPDNTIICHIALGFDFLGYRFSVTGLVVALQTVVRCVVWLSQPDEQGAASSLSGPTGRVGRAGCGYDSEA